MCTGGGRFVEETAADPRRGSDSLSSHSTIDRSPLYDGGEFVVSAFHLEENA
jgi:hypothetical protein